MSILSKINEISRRFPKNTAIISSTDKMTYEELWTLSDKLGLWIEENFQTKDPVVVYGHKSPYMLVGFLACVKTGRAYCPVDISMPMDRIQDIIETVGNKNILITEELHLSGYDIFDIKNTLENYASNDARNLSSDNWVNPEDVFYIIFTSGSTGKPKGVEITADNLFNYANWMSTILGPAEEKAGQVFVDQAPWSFDLSVMDTYTSLFCGGTLFTLNKDLQNNMGELFENLKTSGANYWISTPSFVDMCLADKSFNTTLMPQIKGFWFCGERLTNKTAKTLLERFKDSKAKVVNTYGPTESTVCITSVEITQEIVDNEPLLPVGKPKPGTEIFIYKDEKVMPDGELGEILIAGDTVGKGYLNEKEKTDKVFKTVKINGENKRVYFTGDEGYCKNDMIYCQGRLDFQIKLHGYRIELGDIEEKLLLNPEITSAVVLPKWENEKIKHLVAFVVKENSDGSFQERKAIREEVAKLLPSYMVPKTVKVIDQMPKTSNGKVDRKKLGEEF